MPIPAAAIPVVLEVLAGVARVVGDEVLSVAKQQHPELDTRPVADAGSEMDQAREEALRQALTEDPNEQEDPED